MSWQILKFPQKILRFAFLAGENCSPSWVGVPTLLSAETRKPGAFRSACALVKVDAVNVDAVNASHGTCTRLMRIFLASLGGSEMRRSPLLLCVYRMDKGGSNGIQVACSRSVPVLLESGNCLVYPIRN